MKNIPDSLTPQQAWSKLASRPSLSVETKPITEASHQCLAEPLRAPSDVPIAPRSFMDGFAVRSADVAQTPARLKIAGEILMGEIPARLLTSGEAMFIPTGGFLPEGADAVVMQEDTVREQAGMIVVQKAVAPQENVQLRGEDFRSGSVLFHAHHRLRPQDIATLATFGITEVSVIRKPVLAIISTGNELVDFHKEPGPGQIRETNALTLSSAAQHFGFTVQGFGIFRDELEQQRKAMEKALSVADVVMVSGGSSVGERDYTLEVIRSFPDAAVHFHGLAIRPGNPSIFATIESKSVFGLPGQPVSSLIVFYHFVLPYLFHLSGETIDDSFFLQTRFANLQAILDRSVKPLKLKTDYVRLRLERKQDHWSATPVVGKSASLSTLSQADAFMIVPPGEELIESGAQITAFLFP
jgi:molybdopterin molybdotransferase